MLAVIEPLRKDKKIGSSLQAKVILSGSEDSLAALRPFERQLPMLFIVSEVELRSEPLQVTGAVVHGACTIAIERASGVKCERCWRYVKSVSSEPAFAGLCDRCQDALAEPIHG